MSQDHILLQMSTRRPYKEVPEMPEGASYDQKAGLWRLNGLPMVKERDMTKCTKKCDLETGEDQKGE